MATNEIRHYPPRDGAAFVEWAAERFDVDVDAMARIVADRLRFIIADPQMCNPRTHALTGEGADWLYQELEESYRQLDEMEQELGHPDVELVALYWASKDAEDAARDGGNRDKLRDDRLRAALNSGIPVRDICKATGLSRSRVYQIRDGRR